jgi:dolichol-phosphate mannosyltransferase
VQKSEPTISRTGVATTTAAPTLRLAIVIPLANEAATVNELLQRVSQQITANDRVFCVLDEVSKDTTRQQVEQYSQLDPRVSLVWSPNNRWVVDAYFAGYRAAIAAGAHWILEMDGGLSHQPEEIPRFLAAMQQGYEYVGGCRFMPGGSHRGSRTRKGISWSGTQLANLLLGTRLRDMTSGFECFSRAALLHVLSCGVVSRTHFFQTEIKYLLRHHKWVEVPISYQNPSPGLKAKTLGEACRNLGRLYWNARHQTGEIVPR